VFRSDFFRARRTRCYFYKVPFLIGLLLIRFFSTFPRSLSHPGFSHAGEIMSSPLRVEFPPHFLSRPFSFPLAFFGSFCLSWFFFWNQLHWSVSHLFFTSPATFFPSLCSAFPFLFSNPVYGNVFPTVSLSNYPPPRPLF